MLCLVYRPALTLRSKPDIQCGHHWFVTFEGAIQSNARATIRDISSVDHGGHWMFSFSLRHRKVLGLVY